MSYGHGHELGSDAEGAPGAGKPVPAIDPAQYARPEVCQLLAALDIGGLYRILGQGCGLSQREIARRTGQSQSEVSDIVSGRRRVKNYHLLRRIVVGLEIPPESMGLFWWGPDGTYWGPDGSPDGQVAVADPPEGVEDEVLRRHVLALAAISGFGAQIKGIGELTDSYPQVMHEVAELYSVPTRQRLVPLAEALETRPCSDAKDLARSARQIAATRP